MRHLTRIAWHIAGDRAAALPLRKMRTCRAWHFIRTSGLPLVRQRRLSRSPIRWRSESLPYLVRAIWRERGPDAKLRWPPALRVLALISGVNLVAQATVLLGALLSLSWDRNALPPTVATVITFAGLLALYGTSWLEGSLRAIGNRSADP